MTEYHWNSETSPTPTLYLQQPEASGWKCYLFGNRPDGWGMVYFPSKGQVPNRFVRFMMKVCFDCLWVKEDN